MNTTKPTTRLETKCNKLFDIKGRQKSLKQAEKTLKSEVLNMMGNSNLHKGSNGSIEKICRKPKRIYDSDKLRAVLLKRGMPKKAVEDIIKASTRRISVPEHIAVKVKRSK